VVNTGRSDGSRHSDLNIPIEIVKLIESFLSQQSFAVKIDDHLSSVQCSPFRAGVPQGLCHSPTQFLLFVNDMPKTEKATVISFADDTLYLTKIHNAKRGAI
jgi:hypothetical protein